MGRDEQRERDRQRENQGRRFGKTGARENDLKMPVNGGLMREREGRAGSGEAREEGSTKGKGENKQKEVGEKGDHDPESGGGACAGGSGTLFVVPLPPRVSVNYELPMVKVLE